MKQIRLLMTLLALTLGWSNIYAQTDVTNTYITNADFSSDDGWTKNIPAQFFDIGYGLIGTYNVRFSPATVDDSHLATEYCFGFECRWSTNYASYSQTTGTLPVGHYELSFDVENVNGSTTSASYDDLCYVQIGETKHTSAQTEWMRGKSSWTTHKITFNIAEATTAIISLGYGTGSNNIGADYTPALYVSHLKLTYQSLLDGLKAQWEEANAAAKAALANQDYACVTGVERNTLEVEIAKDKPTTQEGYEAAITALRNATDAFIAAKEAYVDFNTAATAEYPILEYAAQEKRTALDEACNVTPTSAEDAMEKTAAITKALRAYYESNGCAEGVEGAKDYTTYINNPDAEDGNNGWTWTGNKNNPASNEPWTDSDGNSSHKYFDGGTWGASSWTTTMQQDITLPPGKYLLSAMGRAAVNTTLTMSVGEVSANLPHVGNSGNIFDRGWGEAFLVFESDGLTPSTILVTASSSTIHEWFSISHFRLTQIEARGLSDEAIEALISSIPEGKMNAEVKARLDAAKTTLETEKTVEAYNKLVEAISAANNSIAAYSHAIEELNKMVAELEGTNVYTAEAYKTHITDNLSAYDAGTLTDEEANAISMLAGWHGANTIDDVLISAWDAEPESWDELHVNTWSLDGDFEETEFTVPLTEYWVGSGSLAAKTMTATISGLEAGNYKVSADMFIHTSSLPTGISMQVGEASAVSITGTQSGSFYVSEATAFGPVGEDGNLVIKLIVAEGNNTNWVGFKNMKYEKVTVDYAALNAAIANAHAVNATIDGGVKALTDAIADAESLLSSTSQDDIDAGVTTLNAVIEDARTTIAARLNLAGVAKKANALKSFLNSDITEAVTEAALYAANAEATANEASTKADALNANFAEWEVVTLNNGTFDTGLNGELIEPGTEAKPYVHAVDGWTQNFIFNSTAAQGIAAAYGSAAQDGTNGTAAPLADMFGKSEGGTLHLSSGWNDQARYYQVVESLPAGQYVFYYEGFNANNTTNALVSNYFGIGNLSEGDLEGTNDTFKFSDEKQFAYNEWKAVAFDFVLNKNVTDARINVGIVGGTSGSGSTPKMWFDNVTIYCLDKADMADEADYTALAEAIAAVEGKTLGFDASEYAPYENVAAVQALAAAQAIDPTTDNRKQLVQDATAALTAAVWTANTEEVNCIYDGQFANTEPNTTSGDITLPGWTKVQGIRYLVKDVTTDPALDTTEGKAAVFAWGGTTLTYGEQIGYTLPMNVGESYVLTFKIIGWRDGDLPNKVTVSLDGKEVTQDTYVNSRINDADGQFSEIELKFTPENENPLLTINANHHFAIADLNLMKAPAQQGDVNGDTKVDVADVTALVNILKSEGGKPNTADVDGSGTVDSVDVEALVNMILEQEE